ncbi:MarR family winged helix-turn-helix transcriptional regulator [Alicyclobacillus acidiphilus]|uniref:MarR family winged helix-turn-helix transcriptional regulator n=1 Tax=Alicyclobacillus acidiphilus TaxID=182455 RepID=UPI000832F1D4|nr:MarR family transcriptional regulator [Alicyclobacillus acidiphilus]
MNSNTQSLTERFDATLVLVIQNLGPHLMRRLKNELTPSQVFLLHLVKKEGKCPISRLADKMEVARSSITLMLDRLEGHGFVVRERDAEDRRVVTVELTPAGENALENVLAIRKRVIEHCLKQFSEKELEGLLGGLDKLASIAASMDIQRVIESPE